MGQTIWKYRLGLKEYQELTLPTGSKILTVQNQAELPCLWALVDPDIKTIDIRLIEIFGTGNPIAPNFTRREYISTFQLRDGDFVYHVFENVGNL